MSHLIEHPRRSRTAGALCVTALVGCSCSAPTVPVERITAVEVVPDSPALHSIGQQTRVRALSITNKGSVIPTPAAHWSTSDQNTLRIDAQGAVTALRNGTGLVSATVQGVSGAAQLVVDQVVAEVQARPRIQPLIPGNTIPLKAFPFDSLGSPMESATVEWTVLDPAIAEVSATGLVTARALGSTTVFATSTGVSGPARINVVPRDWSHEPPGLDSLASNPWDTLASFGWKHLDRESESRIVSDSTAPSSQYGVLEHVFPQGFGSTGMEPAVDWFQIDGRREIFAGLWWKVSDPWQGHESGINKLFFIWSHSHEADVVFTMRGPPDGPYYVEAVAQRQPDSRTEYLPQNRSRLPVTPGQWHRLEVHLLEDPGGKGVIQWWQDGELVGEYRDFRFASGGWGEFQIAPTWGGVGGPPKREADYIRIDEVYLSGR